MSEKPKAKCDDHYEYKALVEAALDFVAKVDRGEARSTRSYAAFKEGLRRIGE